MTFVDVPQCPNDHLSPDDCIGCFARGCVAYKTREPSDLRSITTTLEYVSYGADDQAYPRHRTDRWFPDLWGPGWTMKQRSVMDFPMFYTKRGHRNRSIVAMLARGLRPGKVADLHGVSVQHVRIVRERYEHEELWADIRRRLWAPEEHYPEPRNPEAAKIIKENPRLRPRPAMMDPNWGHAN